MPTRARIRKTLDPRFDIDNGRLLEAGEDRIEGTDVQVDAELVALTSVAANVVVKLLTTDAWQKAKSGMVALWRRVHPERSESIERDLTDARNDLVSAEADGGAEKVQEVEAVLSSEWQGRLQRLLTLNPELAVRLRALIDEDLQPALSAGQSATSAIISVSAKATGKSRINQVGQGQQTVNERQ